MLGSLTTPGRTATRADAADRVAFRLGNAVGTRDKSAFAAQWPACTLPCRRFAVSLTEADARLGASVGRYAFTVEDFHLLLLAGLPAHYQPAERLTHVETGEPLVGYGLAAYSVCQSQSGLV